MSIKGLDAILATVTHDTQLRHLAVLRELLAKDYFAKPELDAALRDLAAMVRDAIDADPGTLVALHRGGLWTAMTAHGERLEDHHITDHASRSILERVRTTHSPILTTADRPLQVDSESIRRNTLESVIAIPLRLWNTHTSGDNDSKDDSLSGCVYAQRISASRRGPFAQSDVDIVTDVARLAQPLLSVLLHLDYVERALDRTQNEVREMRSQRLEGAALGHFSTANPETAQRVVSPLLRVSRNHTTNLLILGPTGTGKSSLAEAYHAICPRRRQPFIVLDCSQITSVETLSAELFGYAPRSGYVNAPERGRPGKALLAHEGTLFIDEIGALPAPLQQMLLRLLETGRFSALGGSEEHRVDLQVISATHEDLPALVRSRQFREDLFWRLSDVVVTLPPLSERPEDIPELARHFLQRAALRSGTSANPRRLTPAALHALIAHPWERAGNIRGLERTLLRSVLLAPEEIEALDVQHLELQSLALSPPLQAPHGIPLASTSFPARSDSQSLELQRIKAAIREHRYATQAAKALGMTYRQLTWRLHKVGLRVRDIHTSPADD